MLIMRHEPSKQKTTGFNIKLSISCFISPVIILSIKLFGDILFDTKCMPSGNFSGEIPLRGQMGGLLL